MAGAGMGAARLVSMSSLTLQILADAVLLVHFGIVVFVLGGLALIVAGNLLSWPWVNRRWFRFAHLAAIVWVVLTSWASIDCPLTTVESWLRAQAGSARYDQSFIEHWVQRLLFYEAPTWVFTTVYTVFALLVAAAWWCFPPKSGRRPGD